MLCRSATIGPHIVTIKIGPSLKTYNVHKDLNSHYSPYFRAAFEKENFKEGQAGTLKLPNADERMFSIILDWLYGGTVSGIQEHVCNDVCDMATGCTKIKDIVQLYIFADRCDMPQLRNSVCTEFHSCCHGSGLPMSASVTCAFESLPETSTLCRLFADTYTRRFERDQDDADEVAQQSRLPHSFLLQVMLRMSELWQPLKDEEGHLSADGCK